MENNNKISEGQQLRITTLTNLGVYTWDPELTIREVNKAL